jgi:hypothetical protein
VTRRTKHPLEPLHRLRAERVDGEARALGAAQTEAARAEERLAAERAREEAVARERAKVLDGERDALGRGMLRASDLAQGATFAAEMERKRREHEATAAKLAEGRDLAREKVDHQRIAVATARGERDAVKKLLDAEEARRREKEQKAAEEAAEESFSARRHREGTR